MKSKLKFVIIPILLFSVFESAAKKLDLVCDAAMFRIESDRGSLLNDGHIRVVSPAIAAFVQSDGYSTRTTIECEKDKETKTNQCLGLNNNTYCKDPQDIFRVRSTKEDNSVIMVANRCMGGYKKYVIANENYDTDLIPSRRLMYYDDRMAFKMKNQIFFGKNLDYDLEKDRTKPVLTFKMVEPPKGARRTSANISPKSTYSLEISPYSGISMHEQYLLETSCKDK